MTDSTENKMPNTEQIIYDAAEAEFIEKGYDGAKMLNIARRAGVSHSMLHYYFKNKATLFQTVFKERAQRLAPSFQHIFRSDAPIETLIRLFVETHFRFVTQNHHLPLFIVSTIATNADCRKMLIDIIQPTAEATFALLDAKLVEAADSGRIRRITWQELVINVVSLNVTTALGLPLVSEVFGADSGEALEQFLLARRESNVQFILHALRP